MAIQLNIRDLSEIGNIFPFPNSGYSSYRERDSAVHVVIKNREFIPIQSLIQTYGSYTNYPAIELFGNPFLYAFYASRINHSTGAYPESIEAACNIWKRDYFTENSVFTMQTHKHTGGYGIYSIPSAETIGKKLTSADSSCSTRRRSLISKPYPMMKTVVLGFHSLIFQRQMPARKTIYSSLQYVVFKAAFMGAVRRDCLNLLSQPDLSVVTKEQLQETVVLLVDKDIMETQYNKSTGIGQMLTQLVKAYLNAGYEIILVNNLWSFMVEDADERKKWEEDPYSTRKSLERSVRNKLLSDGRIEYLKLTSKEFETTI